jgi:predicted lipoprotein with Yx(FWY)xxD motif
MSGSPQLAPGVNLALFGKVTRPDGTTQATYGGYPLYTYVLDKPLETKGLGAGGTWYLISNAGSPIR